MSFRARLAIFLLLLTVIPVLILSGALLALGSSSREASQKASGALARGLIEDQSRIATKVLKRELGGNQPLRRALREGEQAELAKQLSRLMRRVGGVRVSLQEGGRELITQGKKNALAPGSQQVGLPGPGTRRLLLQLSLLRADEYAFQLQRLSGERVAVFRDQRLLAGSLPPPGEESRTHSLRPTFPGERVEVRLSGGQAGPDLLSPRSLGWLLVLIGLLALTSFSLFLISRGLQSQLGDFLSAARRLGEGDFSAKVPLRGEDEFAQLGGEFNRMAESLEQRIGELEEQRRRSQDSMRRLGEALACRLEREPLLSLIARAAVEGTQSQSGRVRLGEGEASGEYGLPIQGASALERVEAQAVRAGTLSEQESPEGVHALAFPLWDSRGERAVGSLALSRAGRSFDQGERELLAYLAGQASEASVRLSEYERAARDSLRDELTGLANRRALKQEMEAHHEAALLLLDLDDFKLINDRYGHLQGDEMLRALARLLEETVKGSDCCARYGGEEFAILLPRTSRVNARALAEQIRQRAQELRVGRLDGGGYLSLTLSCGLALSPPLPREELLDAADRALYRAKEAGKNRVSE